MKNSSLWTDFVRVYPHTDDGPLPEVDGETYWQNSFYLVFRKELEPELGLDGSVLLTLKRRDGKAIREWKHLQRVKNELVDPEREAVDIFPPQSMVTSMGNEHNLFVVPVGVSSIFVFEEKLRAEGLHGYGAIRGSE